MKEEKNNLLQQIFNFVSVLISPGTKQKGFLQTYFRNLYKVKKTNYKLDEQQQLRLRKRLTPRQADFTDVNLPDLPKVPGMISEYECRYLYWLCSQGYTGSGVVVEVGTWLGRSSIHLAAGLRDSGYDAALHCYDLFTWTKFYNAPHLKHGLLLKNGDDFQPYFEANVRPVYPKIKVTKKAVQHISWDGGPIEILFLDAPKSLQDISAALARFGQYLIPGISMIVMQDYLHSPSYSIATVVSSLHRELEFLHTVSLSSTASFAVREPLNFDKPQSHWNYYKWDKDRIVEAWDRILSPLAPQPRNYLEPGLSMLLLDVGHKDEALKRIKEVKFTAEGMKRWQFLANLHQYYDRYKPLFDTTLK